MSGGNAFASFSYMVKMSIRPKEVDPHPKRKEMTTVTQGMTVIFVGRLGDTVALARLDPQVFRRGSQSQLQRTDRRTEPALVIARSNDRRSKRTDIAAGLSA